MHLGAKPNFNDRASKLKSFPFLLAAFSLTIGSPVSAQSEQLDFGPQFKTVLAVARLNADCYGRQPCVVPSGPSQLLQQEIDGARWIGNGGDEYVDGYQSGLARYLIEQKVRPQIDPNFSAADRGRAELALNILGRYWDCLDRHIRMADESELSTDAALDDLAEGASEICSEYRVKAMTRIAPNAPDFAKFDPIRDGGLSDAGIAEVLHAIQRFAVAYNAGLRGYRHGHAIELILLPAPIVAQSSPTASPLSTPATPRAVEAFTLSSDDCVSVHADGDPWSECGFQSFTVSPDGTRVLTVSALGTTQLWNERGEEIRKVVWSDQPGGASGYPDGRTLIFGQYAIAVVHQNQIVVLDLANGEILAQNATDAMLIDELRPGAQNTALVGFRVWDWHGRRAAELSLPDGRLREADGIDDLALAENQGVWPGTSDGSLLSPRGPNQSALISPSGEELVQFPFSVTTCRSPNWSTQCKISANGRRWLVARRQSSDSQDNNLALTMYEVPSRLEEPALAQNQHPE